MSQEVIEKIAAQYPEPERAEVARILLKYHVAPVNFGRMVLLKADRNRAELAALVEHGNRYGQGWTLYNAPVNKPPYVFPV